MFKRVSSLGLCFVDSADELIGDFTIAEHGHRFTGSPTSISHAVFNIGFESLLCLPSDRAAMHTTDVTYEDLEYWLFHV